MVFWNGISFYHFYKYYASIGHNCKKSWFITHRHWRKSHKKNFFSAALSLANANFGPMKALGTSQLGPIRSPRISCCQSNWQGAVSSNIRSMQSSMLNNFHSIWFLLDMIAKQPFILNINNLTTWLLQNIHSPI